MSCGSSKWYSIQHPPFPSTRSPLHDQREFPSRLSSRVFSGLQPSGLQPEPDVLSSNPEASTSTVVRSAASTRTGVDRAVLAGDRVDGVIITCDGQLLSREGNNMQLSICRQYCTHHFCVFGHEHHTTRDCSQLVSSARLFNCLLYTSPSPRD